MADTLTPALNALSALLDSLFSEMTVIFRDRQVQQINWENLVETFESTTSAGLQPPYGVLAAGPVVDWPEFSPMGCKGLAIPADFFYVRRSTLSSTTVTVGATSATQSVASTAWMFPGQTVLFLGASPFVAQVQTVNSGTSVTFSASVTTATNQVVEEGNAQQSLDVKAQQARDAIIAYTGDAFRILDVNPVIDTSSGIAPNRYFSVGNVPMLAAQVTSRLYVSESY